MDSDGATGYEFPWSKRISGRTLWKQNERDRDSKYWVFRQYELRLFDWTRVSHTYLKYQICQLQCSEGDTFIYGVLIFKYEVSYACIHTLIGLGQHCDIRNACDTMKCILCCFNDSNGFEPLEFGVIPKRILNGFESLEFGAIPKYILN